MILCVPCFNSIDENISEDCIGKFLVLVCCSVAGSSCVTHSGFLIVWKSRYTPLGHLG